MLFTQHLALAQHTLVHKEENSLYLTGQELLQSQKFGAARIAFEKFIETYPRNNNVVNAEYYRAFSSLQLFNPDAEQLFEQFISKYPYHTKATSAYYDLGKFYYNNKNYDKTIEYLEKVDFNKLTPEEQTGGKFRLGYAHFTKKDFEKALTNFNGIKNQQSSYTAASNYYAAYIEYKKDDYEAALTDLKKAENDEIYKSLAPIMAASIYYKKGDFDQVVTYSESVLKSKSTPTGYEELYLLMAEAMYKKKNFKAALDYYNQYLTVGKGKPTSEVQYRIGYAAFKVKDFATAIANFKNVAINKDSSGQSASYLLGVSYMNTNNKAFALVAFDQARKTDFNKSIKKEATFNYAKLCLDLEKYDEGISILKDFIKKYPTDSHEDEAQEMLSESLANSNNPAEALAYIATIKNKTSRVNASLQKVAFNRGVELFNANKYNEAIEMFDKSLGAYSDVPLKVATNFWKGEALSVNKDYEGAVKCYSFVFQNAQKDSEYHIKTRYGIGYAYYNNKMYEKALPHFKEYVTQLKNEKIRPNYNDAVLRLADLYYVTKQYTEATQYYDQIISLKSIDVDYAYFQKGLILGINGKYNEAIAALDMVISKYPNSLYFDNALFQKADFELENSSYPNAIAGFTKIISLHPNSGYIPYAYLKRAIAYSNLQKHGEAVSDYKLILDKFATHPVAQNAILGLQESIAASGKSENMDEVLAKYKEANPKSDALIKIEFENAKSLYNDQKYAQAIESLNNYTKTYEGNPNQQEVNYFLAESYYRLKDKINAIGAYRIVAQDLQSPYYNKAIMRLAELEFANQSYEPSKKFYKQLLAGAKNKKERCNAWLGLMENHFFLQQYDSSNLYINEILNNGNATVDAENKALLYLGKIAMNQGQTEKAMDAFINTINNAKDENGAEAQYLMAEILFSQKQNKQSLETLYDLNNNFSSYENWKGKSFLLMAENFVQMNEMFQAKATLNSLIEKSPNKDVVAKAKLKLAEIDSKEKTLEPSATDSTNQ